MEMESCGEEDEDEDVGNEYVDELEARCEKAGMPREGEEEAENEKRAEEEGREERYRADSRSYVFCCATRTI